MLLYFFEITIAGLLEWTALRVFNRNLADLCRLEQSMEISGSCQASGPGGREGESGPYDLCCKLHGGDDVEHVRGLANGFSLKKAEVIEACAADQYIDAFVFKPF